MLKAPGAITRLAAEVDGFTCSPAPRSRSEMVTE